MYKQEIERARFQTQALTIDKFLDGFESSGQIIAAGAIATFPPRPTHSADQSVQLHHVRRTEAEIQQILSAGLECRVVEVSDRFGDYGLVGAMVFAVRAVSWRLIRSC